ncbi:hypothetical protein NE683_10415 [Bariatricus massiliensis]|uniref:DUF4131 domain-containing protein n=1 Tax=Bariatricus massiliensis TaxID=1745713 RepID=A0ABS8DGM6_9FIRM|nr:hypothetical protein [Bariatricus massiliensis]MCB7304239.1 hypothetical protein [Bariatricus massiliensis]MCB7374890.1 hypothetical protein [Bariatricus massiliensis]MCB7387349.1 hypothetical protein [Bariatricus massiliensis]MCB7411511.1 hypothetical protein [Bariatricus massiliensis]MCQ5253646.1 hypothetical protein [Bariatricus massiliensis]
MSDFEERYNQRKLSSIIWHFLTPTARVCVTVVLMLISVWICLKNHIVYQFMLAIFILFIFMLNCEVLRYRLKRIYYIGIHLLCVLGIIGLIGAGIYTERHFGSFDSITALYTYGQITAKDVEISLAGSTKGGKVFLAQKEITEKNIVSHFEKMEECDLYLKFVDYYGRHHLYSGDRPVGYYIIINQGEFQIIKFFE